jgi:hypothetical protein
VKALAVAFAIALVGAGIALWLVLQKDDPAEGSATTQTPEAHRAQPVQRAQPRPPTTTTPGDVREYEVNGVKVRDHRGPGATPFTVPANIHPPNPHHIASAVARAISDRMRPAVVECMQRVPRDARGDKARLDGTIVISIKDRVARIESSGLELRDVTGESVAPTQACVERKVIGLDTPAPDEPDLDSYPISLAFAVS